MHFDIQYFSFTIILIPSEQKSKSVILPTVQIAIQFILGLRWEPMGSLSALVS